MPSDDYSGFYLPGILAVYLLLFGVLYSAYQSSKIVSESTYALAAIFIGAIFELIRLSKSVKLTLNIIAISFAGALLALLPGKKEVGYSMASHLEAFVFAFIIAVPIVSAVAFRKRVTVSLGEGTTILYTLAWNYWIYLFYQSGQIGFWWMIGLMLPSFYVLVHGLSYKKLDTRERARLSVWTNIVIVAFIGKYIGDISKLEHLDSLVKTDDTWGAAYVFLELFLLGAAGPYIIQNVLMLAEFLPSKRDTNYRGRIKQLIAEHSDRYSPRQISKIEAIIAISTLVLFYYLNINYFNFTSSVVIWGTLMLAPIVMEIFIAFRGRTEIGSGASADSLS
jgi:hypothetical protein